MSVVLFRCPKCDNYSTSAMVNLVMSAKLDPLRGSLRIHGVTYFDFEVDIPLDDIVESRCKWCDGLTELVRRNECPHRWSEARGVQPPYRVCALCGEEQEGRVVFDE